MKRFIVTGLLLIVMLSLYSLKIGGIQLPDETDKYGANLQLNGAGLRKKVVIKVYAGGLYLPQKNSNAHEVILLNDPMFMRMHFIYKKVDNQKLIDAWLEGFSPVLDNFSKEITQFNAMFSTPALKGDVYDILYIPGKGTAVVINGVNQGFVPGYEFKKAVFSIWLGENSALPKLKEKLLGL